MFQQETIRNTVGGAIFIRSLNNGGVTFLDRCTFYNNFGQEGGSISADRGGIIFAQANSFSNDPRYLSFTEGILEIIEFKLKEGGQEEDESGLERLL